MTRKPPSATLPGRCRNPVYVHSYLAKVLEAKGDEGAVAEYAAAVHLDPDNQDALRSYAGYQISHRDFRSALPVLKRLVQLGRRPGDVKNLMRAWIETGRPEEALAAVSGHGEEHSRSLEYVDALLRTGKHAKAAQSAEAMYRETRDPVMPEDVPPGLCPVRCNRHARDLCVPSPGKPRLRHPARLHPPPEICR